MRIRALLLLSTCLVAGGCAPWSYEKPGADPAEVARDRVECERQAEVPRVARPLVWEGGHLVSVPFMNSDPQIHRRCMEARGYTVTPK